MNYIITNQYGTIIGGGTCQDDMYSSIELGPDQILIPNVILPSIQSTFWQYKNGELINTNQSIIPSEPWMVWDDQTAQWVDGRNFQQKYDDACNEVIAQRNFLLYQSDWTQIPNNPLTLEVQQQWADYRQQLRDITNQSGYPFNVVWPTQPE